MRAALDLIASSIMPPSVRYAASNANFVPVVGPHNGPGARSAPRNTVLLDKNRARAKDGDVKTSFDAVLIVSFGGPQGRQDIHPFLANVLRGRRVSPERVARVAHHYELFDGVSPITEITRRQAAGLEERLAAAGRPLPVYVGMRNWHPFLADTFREMREAGVRRVVGFIAAAQHSYSSCQQYRENVAAAREELRSAGTGDIDVTYVDSWFDHPLFIAANAAHVRAALLRLPEGVRSSARLVCTAHSIPVSDGRTFPIPTAAARDGAIGGGQRRNA